LNLRIGIISLGCAKNLVDSEVMIGLLKEKGYDITSEEEKAQILIINTCAFIESAKQESIDTILQLINSKGDHDRKIIVTGCLAQRYAEQLRKELGDDINAILGVGDFPQIVEACETVLSGRGYYRVTKKPEYIYHHETPRFRTTPPHFAYIKIADGCDNRCSYCVIPELRGDYRSRSEDSIVAEVNRLAKSGVREAILIAQDSTYYGHDLSDNTNIVSLLKRLVGIPKIQWIRVLYGHPAHISDDFLKLMAQEEKICSYIDIPVQHIHDDILSKMGRKTNQSQIYDLLEKARRIIPDVTLRTSLIVGFPGEEDIYFRALMKFVEDIQFDHLGVFPYSPEESTKAANMPDQVPESIKQERLNEIAKLHEKISKRKRKQLIGQQKVVLIDKGGKEAIGRTQSQSPEIDDVVFIAEPNHKAGTFIKVEIKGTSGIYDLIGSSIK